MKYSPKNYKKGFTGIPAIIAVVVLVVLGGVYWGVKSNKVVTPWSDEFDVNPNGQSEVTIMVPNDLTAYEKAMNEYISNGGENPAKTWPFVEKKVSISPTTDVIPVAVESAAKQITVQGGQNVSYMKVLNGTAYVLLGMDVDGWAGVSIAIAKVHPIVERTLLNIPGITSVRFERAPGDVVAKTPDQPAVSVLSPNGGERLVRGGTYAIKWSSNPGPMTSPQVALVLYDTLGHNVLQIAPSVSLNGTYNWTIPLTVEPGNYKISAYLSGVGESAGGAIQDYSDNYFTIANEPIAQPGIPSITITSPNGGENWIMGSVYVLKSRIVPGNLHNVTTSFYLIGPDSHTVVSINGCGLSDSYSWNIPSSVQPGQYKIAGEICSSLADAPAPYDTSDDYFTITN